MTQTARINADLSKTFGSLSEGAPAKPVEEGCARHAHKLGGVSPLQALQCELLAKGKGVHREVESEGSRMSAKKNAGGQTPEPTNRNHIEGCTGTDECARQHEVQCCPNPVR